MKRMKLVFGLFLITVLVACGQKAQTFDKVATFNAGFRFSPTGPIYTSLPTATAADWNTLLNKPVVFPSTWTLVAGKPLVFNPDLTVTNPLYKPISYVPDYSEITNKPAEVELATAIIQVPVLIKVLTQTQINALTPQVGEQVFNLTDTTLQLWIGTKWVTFIVNQ